MLRITTGTLLALACGLFLTPTLSHASTNLYETCPSSTPPSCGTVPIPDFPGPPASMALSVPLDPSGCNTITHIDVDVWITHTYQGDLRLTLTSPSGTTITLLDRPGGGAFSAHDLGGTYVISPPPEPRFSPFVFTDIASDKYNNPPVPFPGYTNGWAPGPPSFFAYWKPVNPLSTFNGESKAGTWTLTVTDLAGADVGNIRYLGLHITCEPPTPPIAEITSPGPFACVCNPTTITGTADDPDGTLLGYVLDWSTSPAGPWTLIASLITPVTNGTLATWNTQLPPVPEGYVFLRLTAANALYQFTTYTTVVYVDQTFDSVVIRKPTANQIVGGNVCPDGTINDSCFSNYRVEFAPPPYSSFSPVDSGTPVYNSAIINDPLATWNTRSGISDGPYRLRFTGNNVCGHTAVVMRDVVVDNTPPVAVITSPLQCHYVDGVVSIIGTASDANLASWTLQYTGGASNGWVTIATGSSPVVSSLLANWNVASLQRCAYTMRLVVSDQATVDCGVGSNSAEYEVSVVVGTCCDLNRDGAGDGSDTQPFVNCLLGIGTCP